MRRSDESGRLVEVFCNQCKKKLRVENGYLKEECFKGEFTFGYFSKKDGTKHSFDLCEDCYDKMIGEFAIPVQEEQSTELL